MCFASGSQTGSELPWIERDRHDHGVTLDSHHLHQAVRGHVASAGIGVLIVNRPSAKLRQPGQLCSNCVTRNVRLAEADDAELDVCSCRS